MAVILPDKLYVGGVYLDANISVADVTELSQKALSDDFFLGMEVKMPEAFYSVNEIPYPIDFWSTPNGEDIKWEIKSMPSIETAEDLENFKRFVENFKSELGYYPLNDGFEFLVDGEKYVFDVSESGQATYTIVQSSIDSLIADAVDLAVDEAVNKVTSGASEAFDTLKEVEDWIKENSGKTVDLTGYATEAWVKEQNYLTEHQDISGLATKEETEAVKTWVGEQGFLTEHQDITGKQDVISDLESIREGAAKGATALQSVPEEYVTSEELEAKGYLTEHQDISGLATKDEVAEAVLSAQTYADSLVENLKPYSGGTAVDVTDYAVNVNVAEDGFLKVNEANELTVTGVTLDAAITSKDITIEGGQWATAVKTVFTGGTVPAGTTWQSFLESMLCVEKFDTSYSMSKTFTVTCGTLGEGITGAKNNSSVEVGTKVSLNSFEANPTTASQSYTVSSFDYGYKLGEEGIYNSGTSFKETLTPSLKESNDALTATFTTFVDESGNTIAQISQNTSIPQVDMRVMDGTNKVIIAQTGDTYTSSSAVTAGTIYVATNLKNYYKADKVTPNTYEPKVTPEDKTATASTTYTVTGYRNTFYGTTSSTDAADATFIRTLTKSNKAIVAGNTISFETNSSDGHLRMVIASPRTIKSVKNQTGTQDLTALLVGTKATVSVGGVDNFAPISYNVYDYTWKGAFGNETWIITFA